jgi:hypothetical protein
VDDEANRVVIGMDPHKRSVTIEVMTSDEQVLGGGRFATDVEGFASLAGLCRGLAGPGLGDRGL